MKPWAINMKKILTLFWHLLRVNVKYFLEYRISLLISLFLTFFWVLSYIVFVEVIFHNIDSLAGLNKGQVLLILSFYYLFTTIANIPYRDNFENFAETMRRGELDFILVKPVPHRMMCFLHKMRLDFLSSFAIVAMTMIYAYQFLEESVSLIPLLIGILYSIIGSVIFYSLLSIIASLAFWVSKNDTLGVLIWNFSQIARYPRGIFSESIQKIFTFILPFALLANIPAEITAQIIEPKMMLYTILTTVLIYIFSLLLWNTGIKRYSSAN